MEHIFKAENFKYVSKRLKTRIFIFLVIAVLMFGVMSYDVLEGQAAWWMAALGVIVGLVIGFVFGRLARVQWHESEEKIVTQMDAIGVVVIIAYIGLAVLRNVLLEDFLSGTALTTVSFALVSGILLGRFFGMHISIMKVLKERIG